MKMDQKTKLDMLTNARLDFKYFTNNIFSLSFSKFIPAPHINEWCDIFQHNKFAAILGPRKHLKSTISYSHLMWKMLCADDKLEVLYLSFKSDLAAYHTRNIKDLISRNPFFEDLIDTKTAAEGIMSYYWDGDKKNKIVVEPDGILAFKRGRHPDIVYCDDILADPSNVLNPSVIQKINRIFFEDVMSLPKEGGELKLVGTAQDPQDLFFKVKMMPRFKWAMYRAIESYNEKKVLWPELFTFKRLIEIKDHEIGEKAFNKEYQCSPISVEEAFFKREEIDKVVKSNLRCLKITDVIDTDNDVVAGWDLGKKRHPSHIVVFEIVRDSLIMIHQQFLDGWDYTDQVKYINQIIENYKINKLYFDNTRAEMDGFIEQKILSDKAIPKNLNQKYENTIAIEFEKYIKNDKIRLMDKARMINQILTVRNDLKAIETVEGHGDSFWSIALACMAASDMRKYDGRLSVTWV